MESKVDIIDHAKASTSQSNTAAVSISISNCRGWTSKQLIRIYKV